MYFSNVKKIFLSALVFTGAVFFSFAAPKQVRVGVLNGPSSVPCAYLMENKDNSGIKNLSFENFTSAQTELPKLLKNEIDIGFLPPNVAAKVFNSANGAVVCLGITGNGNLFLISKKQGNVTLESLRGKTIQCAGQGATPEYMIKYLLSKQNIPVNPENKEEGITLDFSVPNANIAAALISDKCEFALLPEPFATVAEVKSHDVKRSIDIQKLFARQNGGTYPMTLLVANAGFAKSNKALTAKFIEAYKEAYEWTVKNPAHAGVLSEKHNLGLASKIVEKAVPNIDFTWKTAEEGKSEIEQLLSIFLENAGESIGGKLPSDGFYFEVK